LTALFDKVLLDAPCSGTGVMQRHPESRWTRTERDIVRICGVQARLLDAVCPMVRPGGVLVYSTCSLEPEENELQIQAFLNRHPEFILEPVPAGIPEAFVTLEGYLRITPYEHAADGMFGVRMRKRRTS
jgi:16S rRNA (cytosine967-C5)-methyltransferase